MVKIIGIAGGSCSGKTTLTNKLIERLGQDKAVWIAQDNYYIDVRILRPDGGLPNFDAPDAIEFDLLAEHLRMLKSGRSVDMPVYDFATHHRTEETLHIEPVPFILLDGMLILTQGKIRDLLDDSIYLECPANMRLSRRLARDTESRGRTRKSIIAQFQNEVDPSHDKYVSPSKVHAHRVISQRDYLYKRDKIVTTLIEEWTGG